jgi:type IV pilus assembly protein PilW
MTLTELVVVSGIVTVLTGLVYGTFRYQANTYRERSSQVATQDLLRLWLARMVRDIRQAGYDPTHSGNFGFLVYRSDEIAFTADRNANGVVDPGESVGYRLRNGSLEQWTGGSQYRTVLSGVGSLYFTYRDAQGKVVTSVPQAIRSVEIALGVEVPKTPFSRSAPSLPAPTVLVGSERTTISPPPSAENTAGVYAHVERAGVRNFR